MNETNEKGTAKPKYDVERWVEKIFARYREYRFLGFNESVHWHSDPDGFIAYLKANYGHSLGTFKQYRKRFVDYALKHGYPEVAEILRAASVVKDRKVDKKQAKISVAVSAGAKDKRVEKVKRMQEVGSAGYEASLLGYGEVVDLRLKLTHLLR